MGGTTTVGIASGGTTGATGDTAGDGAGAAAGAAAGASNSSGSSCAVSWGSPASDPGYRGLRGAFNGQALNVDGDYATATVSICQKNGVGPTPVFSVNFAPPGLSFEFGPCAARMTSPTDTDWHDLTIHLSTAVADPTAGTSAEPATVLMDPAMSGHVQLQGESADGPIVIDADFCLDARLNDPCALKPG